MSVTGSAAGVTRAVEIFEAVEEAKLVRSIAPAKRRILETANRLFYNEGIRNVGVDRLISESHVTKATFYKHYGSKDRLILEYISQRSESVQDLVAVIIAETPAPAEALQRMVHDISSIATLPFFRGCPFINAAIEFIDPEHPVRQVVSRHRDWYTETLFTLLAQVGHPEPRDGADEMMLARDGVMSGGYAGNRVTAIAAFQRSVARILSRITPTH